MLIISSEQVSGLCKDPTETYKVIAPTNVSSDFADDNPNVRVVGTDLSPIQPAWIPPNLQL
jgi:hypothetical protein